MHTFPLAQMSAIGVPKWYPLDRPGLNLNGAPLFLIAGKLPSLKLALSSIARTVERF